MPTRGESRICTRHRTSSLALTIGLVGTCGILAGLAGCGPFLEALAVGVTGQPLPAATSSAVVTATAASTPSAIPTPTPAVASLTATIEDRGIAAPYPSGFFTARYDLAANGGQGLGPVSFPLPDQPVQVIVTGSKTTMRPQIECQDTTNQNIVFLAAKNTTSNVHTVTFIPHTADPLSFSIIDTSAVSGPISVELDFLVPTSP